MELIDFILATTLGTVGVGGTLTIVVVYLMIIKTLTAKMEANNKLLDQKLEDNNRFIQEKIKNIVHDELKGVKNELLKEGQKEYNHVLSHVKEVEGNVGILKEILDIKYESLEKALTESGEEYLNKIKEANENIKKVK